MTENGRISSHNILIELETVVVVFLPAFRHLSFNFAMKVSISIPFLIISFYCCYRRCVTHFDMTASSHSRSLKQLYVSLWLKLVLSFTFQRLLSMVSLPPLLQSRGCQLGCRIERQYLNVHAYIT